MWIVDKNITGLKIFFFPIAILVYFIWSYHEQDKTFPTAYSISHKEPYINEFLRAFGKLMEKEFDLKCREEGCGRNSPLWVEFCFDLAFTSPTYRDFIKHELSEYIGG